MSECKICFHRGDGKIMQRPVAGECERCNPRPVEAALDDACVCPPLGEPRGRRATKKSIKTTFPII